MELTDEEISILWDSLEVIADRAHHYRDADMGWSSEEIDGFYAVREKVRQLAKERKFWWAQH